MPKCSVVPMHFTVDTNERVYSHSDQSTDTTVSTHASDYVYKSKGVKPGWVQMAGGLDLLGDNCDSDRKATVVEKIYVDYCVGGEGRSTSAEVVCAGSLC